MLVSTVPSVLPSVVSLLDEIATDENVTDAIGEAISLASTKTLQDFVPGDSPLGYVGSRLFLEAVTLATGRLRPYDFLPSDTGNQRHLVNEDRYSSPIKLIPSGAKKVAGGFRVAGKGHMTLYMINNCGQGIMFSEDGELVNNPAFWILHEIIGQTGRLKVYLARPTRLLKNGTFLETTEFRTIFDDVLEVLTANSLAATQVLMSEANLPQGAEIEVPFIEVDEP